MANPADTNPPSTPEPEFDALEFWIRNRTKIIALIVIFLAGVLIYGVYEFIQTRTHNNAAAALAEAKSADDYQKVISEYPSTAAAGDARLLLAEQLRNSGKYDESTKALQDFINTYPDSKLISGAYTSLAANQEAQGQLDAAISTLQKVTTSYPTSFSAPLAWLAQGRILKAQGKNEEAKRAYETVINQFGETPFGQEAMRLNQQLAKQAGPAPAVTPVPSSPTPAPAPATPAPSPESAAPATPKEPEQKPATPVADTPAAAASEAKPAQPTTPEGAPNK